mgnify:CR=1 FL=1
MTPENVNAVIDTVKGTVLPSERIAMFNKACAIDPHDTVVIEELSELIKAVSKINRCHNNKHLKSLKKLLMLELLLSVSCVNIILKKTILISS